MNPDGSQREPTAGALLRFRSFGAFLAVAGLAVTWFGCSIEKHYHLLSRFFDGVPDPALVKAGSDAVALARLTGAVYFTHEPYAKEQCESCHTMTANMQLSTVDSTSCVKCHEGVKTEHARMHGPVVAGACLFCHAPHESTVEPLLRVPSQQLCVQCHGTSLARRPPGKEIPEHSDSQRSCLDCHYGHGGDSRAYLREMNIAGGEVLRGVPVQAGTPDARETAPRRTGFPPAPE